jgi:uncharacterized membrane protein YkvI
LTESGGSAIRALALIRAVLTILVLAVLLDLALSISWWQYYDITDAPWWVGFLAFGFAYLCALPGLLIPYAFVALRHRAPRSHWTQGVISGLIVGVLYPASLMVLTALGAAIGLEMHWDRLVEHPVGWLILALITLGPGVVLSWGSLRIESRVCGRA